MTNKEALKVLEDHQKWSLGDDSVNATNPKELTKAIKVAFASLSESMEDKYGWRKVSEELPSYDDGLVVVKVRNKNKEDGIFLYDICYIDEETHTWSERYHTWEDIIEWKPID